MAHALETILDAAALLAGEPNGDQYRFLLLGDGARKKGLKKRTKDEGLTNVIFIDSVSKDQVVRYWSILDVSIIHLKKSDLFTKVIPSKLFECMAMAVPVLHGVEGESAKIVENEDVGITFEPENAPALVSGLKRMKEDKKLFRHLAGNGPVAAKKYDRAVLANNMLDVLLKIGERRVK